jgi:hypothetical protein
MCSLAASPLALRWFRPARKHLQRYPQEEFPLSRPRAARGVRVPMRAGLCRIVDADFREYPSREVG